MSYILQVDFPYTGPWGPEMTAAMDGLARSIADEPGLIWKIWTENQEANEAGGVYCFRDAQSAKAYLAMHTARLKGFGSMPFCVELDNLKDTDAPIHQPAAMLVAAD